MATAEHTATGTYSKIPLGRRISELMQERGDAFSIRAFAERIGMNRETFRLTLLGERPITLTLLEKVTKGLHVTEERLRQLDTFKKEEELSSLLNSPDKTRVKILRAQAIARELVDVSLGITERCMSWANLGRAQYYLQEYDLAHESFQTAMTYAEKVNELYGDSTLLYHITSYLMVSYTIRKEYTNIEHTLNVVENAFAKDPEKMGYVHYTRMKWHEHRGNFDQAKIHAYVAQEYFTQTHSKSQIGKAHINVAHFEYLTGNYQKAKEELQYAMENLKSSDYFYLLAVKDYVKVLLQLDEKSVASQVLGDHFERAKEYPDFMGIFQVMYSISMNDPSHAESVSDNLGMSNWIRNIACRSLMDYYALQGDSESLMRYYEKVSKLSDKKNEYLEEGF